MRTARAAPAATRARNHHGPRPGQSQPQWNRAVSSGAAREYVVQGVGHLLHIERPQPVAARNAKPSPRAGGRRRSARARRKRSAWAATR